MTIAMVAGCVILTKTFAPSFAIVARDGSSDYNSILDQDLEVLRRIEMADKNDYVAPPGVSSGQSDYVAPQVRQSNKMTM